MNIGVFTRNQHRCNTMLATLMIKALKELGYNVITSLDNDDSNTIMSFAFVFNGKLDAGYVDIIDHLHIRGIPIVYLVDDVDLELPDVEKIDTFVQQFICNDVRNKCNIFFPIAELLTMGPMWDIGIGKVNKAFGYEDGTVFYGGTYKDRRDYSVLEKFNNLIIAGDDDRWNYVSDKALVIPTIRDINKLYSFMSKNCLSTLLVYDEKHYLKGMPLRFFEAALCNLKVIVHGESEKDAVTFTPNQIRALYTKELFLEKLKGLICNMQAQIQMKF